MERRLGSTSARRGPGELMGATYARVVSAQFGASSRYGKTWRARFNLLPLPRGAGQFIQGVRKLHSRPPIRAPREYRKR